MVDFHLHTRFSDGCLTPSELVNRAYNSGVKAISITDHDTLNGLDDGYKSANDLGLIFINGIEISTMVEDINDEIHIIGLNFNKSDRALIDMCLELKENRFQRNTALINKLDSIGITIDKNELLADKTICSIGKPDFAYYLYKKKIISCVYQAYDYYLKDDEGFCIKKKLIDYKKVIEIIRNAGGVAILAHPLQIDIPKEKLLELVNKLTLVGLNGIEIYYNGYKKKDIKYLKSIAKKYELFISGGSDFHCDNMRNSIIGFYGKKKNIPFVLYDNLLKLY